MERWIMVTGSRDWEDAALIERVLDKWRTRSALPLVLIHGGCPTGADNLADAWARKHGVRVQRFPAQWARYGRRAGPRRNAEMVKLPALSVVCAFSRNHSPGTENAIRLAKQRRGLVVEIHRAP
jgi:hypothetical protein